jgi:hypothetical protein
LPAPARLRMGYRQGGGRQTVCPALLTLACGVLGCTTGRPFRTSFTPFAAVPAFLVDRGSAEAAAVTGERVSGNSGGRQQRARRVAAAHLASRFYGRLEVRRRRCCCRPPAQEREGPPLSALLLEVPALPVAPSVRPEGRHRRCCRPTLCCAAR